MRRQAPETDGKRGKAELRKPRAAVLRFNTGGNENAVVNEVFRSFEEKIKKLQNCNFYPGKVYNYEFI